MCIKFSAIMKSYAPLGLFFFWTRPSQPAKLSVLVGKTVLTAPNSMIEEGSAAARWITVLKIWGTRLWHEYQGPRLVFPLAAQRERFAHTVFRYKNRRARLRGARADVRQRPPDTA